MTRQNDDRSDRIAGGVYGLLVGDAMGVPYEFSPPEALPPLDSIEFVPPAGFRRAHAAAPPGAWSDDGAHALCLLSSLLECGRLDLGDLGRRLLAWLESGYLAVEDHVYDVGNQTLMALAALRQGVAPDRSGPTEERYNGNGSLMRVLPLAIWHRGSDEELLADAALQSLVTHGHPRSQVCCALYCLWARAEMHGLAGAWERAVETVRASCGDRPEWAAELQHVRPDEAPSGTGQGYVVDCLNSARLAAAEPTYERAIRKAISLGNDTDTTACVVGGIVGLRHGLRSIPQRWLSSLAGRAVVEPLLSRLLDHCQIRSNED